MVLGERRPRTIVGATAALTLSILLGGCTDGSAGTPTPTVSTSEAQSVEPSSAAPEPTTAAPSAEVEKPVPPEAMRRDDVAGAEAAAQYFLELYPYVYATGDLTEWDAMSDPECKFCESVRRNAEELHAGGGYGVGPNVLIEKTDALPPREGNRYFAVWVEAMEGSSAQHSSDGAQIASSDGGPVAFDLAVRRDGDNWVVGEVSVESAGA